MKPRDVAHAIEHKTPGIGGDGKERSRWIIVDGKRVMRVFYPKSHSADIKRGTLEQIRKSLRLDQDGFYDFISCSMSSTEYVTHLRELLDSGAL
jgi:hypothetical protein